jgi:hypothetical protein
MFRAGMIAAGLLLGVSGCASLQMKDVNGDGAITPHDVGRAFNGPPLVMPPHLQTRFDSEESTATVEIKRPLRREAVRVLMSVSDTRCDDYMVGITAGRNTYGLGFEILGSMMSTIGGLVTHAPAANAFSAASTFSRATSDSVTQALFGGRELSLMSTAVRTGRIARAREIEAAVARGEFDTWSPESILRQIDAYDRDCGVRYGLDVLGQAAQRAEPPETTPGS